MTLVEEMDINNLFSLVLLLIIFLTLLEYFRFFCSIRYISKNQNLISFGNLPSTVYLPVIHILIPVLGEVSIISENVNLFSRLNGSYKLHYITTEREANRNRDYLNPTRRKLEQLNQEGFKFNIIHYPKKNGTMAHQLNYAITQLLKYYNMKDGDYVLVYNADSKVHKNVINDFYNFLLRYNFPEIIHQPSLFLENYESFTGWSNFILKNIALLQSRWTLTCEIPRILSSSSSKKWRNFFESGHLVGHGMMLKVSTLKQIGGFFTNYRNEDLPMGYVLSNLGKPIHVFPFLENAESPRTIKQIIRQYTTWYYGACGYLQYMKDYFTTTKNFSWRALITGLRNQLRALLWLLSGVFWVLIIITPFLIEMWLYGVIFLFIFFVRHTLLYYFVLRFANNLTQTNFYVNKSRKMSYVQILLSPFTYVLHTIGPIRAVGQILYSIISDKVFEKEKTER